MRLCTLAIDDAEILCIGTPKGYVPLKNVNRFLHQRWDNQLLPLLVSGAFDRLLEWYNSGGKQALASHPQFPVIQPPYTYAPLYRHPPKIWGIGLNYQEHAHDLSERSPDTIPVGFMKPDTTIIAAGDTIKIPHQSHRTTAEAELGLVIKRKCRKVARKDWRNVLAGFTGVIDVTAEDILRQNPRYLTLSKSFDTFFSFGPELLSVDEIRSVSGIGVTTVINGRPHRSNRVGNMTFLPDFLIAYLSEVMTLLPGDVISTGTPGAAVLRHGDIIECRIEGFASLKNPVIDLKKPHRT
jgi:2-keto-4-pentenoate hydratase/2-oxohepta-3-ene-1,7-dioic acid hydratase in catechol pathway